jgi:hypothetical protein
MNRRAFEMLILSGSIAALALGAVIYLKAQPQAKADFHKILFEKLLLAVIVASAGVILKRWVDDWNTKRKFFLCFEALCLGGKVGVRVFLRRARQKEDGKALAPIRATTQ